MLLASEKWYSCTSLASGTFRETSFSFWDFHFSPWVTIFSGRGPSKPISCKICFLFKMNGAITPKGSKTEATVDNVPLWVAGRSCRSEIVFFCFVLWHINYKGSFNAGSVFEVNWCYFIFIIFLVYFVEKKILCGGISLNTLLSIYFVWTFIISIFLTFLGGICFVFF